MYKILIGNKMPYGKGLLSQRACAASLNMTDGCVYHRINFISKTLLPTFEKKKTCDNRKSQNVLFCPARVVLGRLHRHLLVKKVVVHLYLWVGFEVIRHQHDRDLNMAQFIDLGKYKINRAGYYHPGKDSLTSTRTCKRAWWPWEFCLPSASHAEPFPPVILSPSLGFTPPSSHPASSLPPWAWVAQDKWGSGGGEEQVLRLFVP